MKNIHTEKLKKNLTKKLYAYYVLLGEDFFLLKKNQDLILNFAYKKGYSKKITINIEKNKDWDKIIFFYKTQNLFFKKTTLVINFIIEKINVTLIKNINQISSSINSNIFIILKFNHLSISIQENKLLDEFKKYNNIVSCFTPYNLHFINWIKYEIREKNINIEKKAFFLLCKHYEGNTLLIDKILNILLMTYPNTYITIEKIKKIIIDFFNFHPLHWINAIFQGKTQKALYILNVFFEQKNSPLILIRYLQQDLLKLIYIKREQNININISLKKNNVLSTRYTFFKNAFKKINNINLFKAIQILVKIEIKIKKKYNNSVWNQLQELTLILC